MSEHDSQVTIFQMLELASLNHPELKLVFAVPNGGARHPVVAKKLKAEGVKAGIPDIWFPVPKNKWSGLVIEQKFGKNKVTKEQAWWLSELSQHGWYCKVSWSVDDTIETFANYLGKRII